MKSNSFVSTQKRLLIALMSITFLFCVLGIRVGYIQLKKGEMLTKRATEQWHRELPLKAKRGTIYDRSGEIIADSKDVFTVYVRPRSVENVDAVTKILSDTLNVNAEQLRTKIEKKNVSEITVKKQVDFQVGDKLRQMNLKGVYFSIDAQRNYAHSSYLTQVLGYTNADNEGQNGLEGYYDKFLRGTNGITATETDNSGIELENGITDYIPAIDGASLKTTLDLNIQGFVENAVKGATIEHKAKGVNMMVMDVRSGGIVAMAQSPTYDLSNLPRDDIDMLNAYSKNKMIVDVYEPGSTFKIFTTAIALENGVVNNSNRFFCSGSRNVDGQRIKCWRTIGHGSQDLGEGVKNSCNCVFMDLALRLGTEKFYKGLNEFGFGKKTKVDFFSESSGLLMKAQNVKTVDLARIGFGQAVAVTPLQLLAGVSTVVNGGNKVTPHFVESIIDTMNNEIYKADYIQERVISKSTSETMRLLLEAVVSEGSGKKASVAGYRIGGKTGTAQKYENGIIAQGKYVSSFVGFAPANEPKYAILLTVDEPNSYAYYGSIVCAPYVGQVFSQIFEYEGITKGIDSDTKEIELPWLDGKSINESVKILEQLGIYYEIDGEGEQVKKTLPSGGSILSNKEIVLLYT